MIQFNKGEVCELLRAIENYKDSTGSEYLWDKYDKLQHKLYNYGQEISEVELTCETQQN